MTGSKPKSISVPEKSPELAEFVGIMLGDGGVSTYQATVTLHSRDDLEYSHYVCQSIKLLFGYKPSVLPRKGCLALKVLMSRIEIVRYLKSVGVPIGNKMHHSIDIPKWIKERPDFYIPCIRGLVDTDGSVFKHTYLSKGKRYSYKKLSFTSGSMPLLNSVYSLLTTLGIRARIGSNRDVRVDSITSMERYFSIIGSHNPKHLRRYFS